VLRSLEYYKNDPAFKLATVGYKCGACSLTLSEAGRAKDSLGGKDGKGIAKAKCPKCQQKFGDNLLISLAEPAPAESAPAAE
jgi:DNA-directed RNA polymerase subunit RPC12/RpoP